MEAPQGPIATEKVDVAFHGVEYTLSVGVSPDDALTVEIEEVESLARWRGAFTAKYVEDITSKTGSFKKFPVFVRMLISAARGQSDSVFMDLLTFQDLEALKNKKQQQQGAHVTATAAAVGTAAGLPADAAARPLPPSAVGKRYLILTYASEFDRVHYPLPLAPLDGGPEPARLLAIISQLRGEVANLRADNSAPATAAARRAKGTGEAGQQQSRRRGVGRGGGVGGEDDVVAGGGDDCGGVATATDLSARRVSGAFACSSGAEDFGGSTTAVALAQRLETVTRERDHLRLRLEEAEGSAERTAALHRRELRRRDREIGEAHDELIQARETARQLHAKCRHLEEELEVARRRTRASSSGGGAAAAPHTYASAGGLRPNESTYHRRPSGSGVPPTSAYLAGASKFPGGGSRGGTPSRTASGSRGVSPARGGSVGGSGGSAAGSRGASPGGYARPWATGSAASTPRAGSRPSSAPPRPRFDPTEYVRQKREREAATAAARGATFGGGGSRSGTPVRGAGSAAGSSAAASPVVSRPGSRGRGSAGGVTGLGAYSNAGGSRRPSAAASPAGRPTRSAGGSGGGMGAGVAALQGERFSSPGRALQTVQQKLSEFVSRQQQHQNQEFNDTAMLSGMSTHSRPPPPAAGLDASFGPESGPVAAVPEAPGPALTGGGAAVSAAAAGVFDDASSEIADIDRRLASLQNFLRSARTGGS